MLMDKEPHMCMSAYDMRKHLVQQASEAEGGSLHEGNAKML